MKPSLCIRRSTSIWLFKRWRWWVQFLLRVMKYLIISFPLSNNEAKRYSMRLEKEEKIDIILFFLSYILLKVESSFWLSHLYHNGTACDSKQNCCGFDSDSRISYFYFPILARRYVPLDMSQNRRTQYLDAWFLS